jgi:hypothetical protein
MRKFLVITLSGLVLFLVIGALFFWAGLRQLREPTSGVSAKFTASFVDRCIAASQRGDQVQSSQDGGAVDNVATLCQCAADDMREDLADAGLTGFVRMVLVEGLDAKMQRVMDGCQSTPSAP